MESVESQHAHDVQRYTGNLSQHRAGRILGLLPLAEGRHHHPKQLFDRCHIALLACVRRFPAFPGPIIGNLMFTYDALESNVFPLNQCPWVRI